MALSSTLVAVSFMLGAAPPEVTLRGTVKDPQGKPLARVRVDVAAAAPKQGPALLCPTCYPDCSKSTRTDADGRFTFTGLDPSLKFSLLASAPDREPAQTRATDPTKGDVAITLAPRSTDFPPARTVVGTLVDDRGKPVGGALLYPAGAKTAEDHWSGQVEGVSPTVSDDDGDFRVVLPESFQGVDLEVTAQGFAGTLARLLKPGPERHRIVVPSGARVTGKLSHDGKPVPDCRIAVVQEERGGEGHFIKAVAAVTADDGTFLFERLPASQSYVIFTIAGAGPQRLVLTTQRFLVPADRETRDLGELPLISARRLAGRVDMGPGRKLPRDTRVLVHRNPAWDSVVVRLDEEGRFAVEGLPPEVYEVRVHADGYRIDPTRLLYQMVGDHEFGLRLRESVEDLHIPLVPADGAPRIAAAKPPAEPKPDPAPPAPRVDTGPVDPDAITVRGVVAGPDDRPLAGATVVLRAQTRGMYASGFAEDNHNHDILARSTTEGDGRFVFTKVGVPARFHENLDRLRLQEGGAEVVAWAEGRGTSWVELDGLRIDEPLRLVLGPAAKVDGVVRDKAGRGVPGVEVGVFGLTRGSRELHGTFNQPGDLNLSRSELSIAAKTDAEGRFSLPHLPLDRRAVVAFACPGWARHSLWLDTGDRKDLKKIRSVSGEEKPEPVFRSPLRVTLERQRSLRVKVEDDAGRPVGRGHLELIDDQRHYAGSGDVNERGEAAIGLREPGDYVLYFNGGDARRPGLGTSFPVNIAAGKNDVPFAVRLPAVREITGRVVEADTDTGVSGVYVSYAQSSDRSGGDPPAFSSASTEKDGTFRLLAVVGPGTVSAEPDPDHVVPEGGARVKVDVPAAGSARPVTFSLPPAPAIHVTVRDPKGKPAAGVAVQIEPQGRDSVRTTAVTDAQGRFRVRGLAPRIGVTLCVSGREGFARTLVTIDGDRTRRQDVELKLRPAVALTGRVLYQGKPRSGVRLNLFRTFDEKVDEMPMTRQLMTDARGEYRVDGLLPGQHFEFEVIDPDGLSDPHWKHQTYSCPVPDGQPEVRLPDIKLATRGQSLLGVVVDPRGKPVSGITVSASLPDFGVSLRRPPTGPPPWTNTDADGRFELSQLPDEPLELMAYVRNPAGGHIRFPCTVRPARNQQNIRIVLDPTLHERIEDLDAARKR